MSDPTIDPLGPAARSVERTMGDLVDMMTGRENGGKSGMAPPAAPPSNRHCHDDDTLHRDKRNGEYVTPKLEHVTRGPGARDQRGSASRFTEDY